MVAHQDKVCPLKINRLKQMPTERNVQHGNLVENDNVCVYRIVQPPLEHVAVVSEQTMYRGCQHARGLFHPFCSLSRRRCENHSQIGVEVNVDDA